MTAQERGGRADWVPAFAGMTAKPVVTAQNIPGITGGALDSDEGAPGPILLQGDHGPVEFRRIVVEEPVKRWR